MNSVPLTATFRPLAGVVHSRDSRVQPSGTVSPTVQSTSAARTKVISAEPSSPSGRSVKVPPGMNEVSPVNSKVVPPGERSVSCFRTVMLTGSGSSVT